MEKKENNKQLMIFKKLAIFIISHSHNTPPPRNLPPIKNIIFQVPGLVKVAKLQKTINPHKSNHHYPGLRGKRKLILEYSEAVSIGENRNKKKSILVSILPDLTEWPSKCMINLINGGTLIKTNRCAWQVIKWADGIQWTTRKLFKVAMGLGIVQPDKSFG